MAPATFLVLLHGPSPVCKDGVGKPTQEIPGAEEGKAFKDEAAKFVERFADKQREGKGDAF